MVLRSRGRGAWRLILRRIGYPRIDSFRSGDFFMPRTLKPMEDDGDTDGTRPHKDGHHVGARLGRFSGRPVVPAAEGVSGAFYPGKSDDLA